VIHLNKLRACEEHFAEYPYSIEVLRYSEVTRSPYDPATTNSLWMQLRID
jgi:hypothetical protein